MGERPHGAKYEVPVVCTLCGTRMYTSLDNIGKSIVCPDCDTPNLIKQPPPKPPPAKPKYSGDEYKVEPEPRAVDPAKLPVHVKVTCRLCSTSVQVRIEHVGKRIKCPDCGTPNVIPPPPIELRPFHMPDASDVRLDDPPPPVDQLRKDLADRLMADAKQEIRRRDEEDPQPRSPIETNPLHFAFRLRIIPIWLGLSASIYALYAMIATIASMVGSITPGSLSFEPIMAIFVVVITSLTTLLVAGIFLPHLFSIAVFTAEGHDEIPYWPSHDMLERGRAILFAINGFALGAAPGMLVALALSPLGIPSWAGLPFALFFSPIVMLSMMEADSPFAPFSAQIKSSMSKHGSSWSSFYVQTIGMAAVLVFATALAWLANPHAGQAVLIVGLSIYAVIYSHSLGRLAWVLGESEEEPIHQAQPEAE